MLWSPINKPEAGPLCEGALDSTLPGKFTKDLTNYRYFNTLTVQFKESFDMPLYNKLPDNLHEVDVIVSGGR